jgi:hypothetical protein
MDRCPNLTKVKKAQELVHHLFAKIEKWLLSSLSRRLSSYPAPPELLHETDPALSGWIALKFNILCPSLWPMIYTSGFYPKELTRLLLLNVCGTVV